jgi:uncharacterized protein
MRSDALTREGAMTMPDRDFMFRGHLQELDREECLELLASKAVGRLAYHSEDGLEVLPLNYVLQGDKVLMRTSPHTTLGRQSHMDTAAFEVDEIDDATESGWSVLVRGTVNPLDVDDLPPTTARPRPWASGHRMLYLRLRPLSITGRRLLPGPEPGSST